MNDYLALFLGLAAAGVGGELFVRGAIGLAQWWRIPAGIIGATVAAFATSSPELSVSINAALANKPEIALGDALGSNVVNVALILGIALIFSEIKSPHDRIKRDFPVAALVPIITAILFLDGTLSRLDGFLMLSIFIAWLVSTLWEAKKQRSVSANILGAHKPSRILLSCIVGFGLLVIAGNLVVDGARGIALSFGINEFVIGASIVAIGTSMPELATVIIARWRGHDEISIGTILGSNIFNGLLIVALAATINPITVDPGEVALALIIGLVGIVLIIPDKTGLIERRRGALLLTLYITYLFALFHTQSS